MIAQMNDSETNPSIVVGCEDQGNAGDAQAFGDLGVRHRSQANMENRLVKAAVRGAQAIPSLQC